MKQLILILVLIGSISTANAYNSETGLDENETFHADYSLWLGEMGDPNAMKFHTCTENGVYVYRPNTQGLDLLALFSWTSWKITTHFLSGSDVGIWTSWQLQGRRYNDDTGEYEDIGSSDTVNQLTNFSGGMTVTETQTRNVVRGYLLKPTTETDTFIGWDDEPETPDYIEVTMTVGNGLVDIEHEQTIGVTMTTEQAQSIGEGDTDIDYGFGTGRGGEGGTSGIYDRVSVEDTTETSKTFNILFYAIIPLIFFLLGFKLIIKIVGTYGGK